MSDTTRSMMIRLAATLPKGSSERKALLSVIALDKTVGFKLEAMSLGPQRVVFSLSFVSPDWDKDRAGFEAFAGNDIYAADGVHLVVSKVSRAGEQAVERELSRGARVVSQMMTKAGATPEFKFSPIRPSRWGDAQVQAKTNGGFILPPTLNLDTVVQAIKMALGRLGWPVQA